MDHQLPVPHGDSPDPESGPGSDGPRRLEVVARKMVTYLPEFALHRDGEEIGEFEWVDGRYPELHLEAGEYSAYVGLRRLRPFVLSGRSERRDGNPIEILHAGSAGQGLVEVGGTQFLRRTSWTGRLEVRDAAGAVVLTTKVPTGKPLLVYDHTSSNLHVPEILDLALVETFLAMYSFSKKYMIHAMFSAFVRRPKLGTPLLALPKVAAAVQAGPEMLPAVHRRSP